MQVTCLNCSSDLNFPSQTSIVDERRELVTSLQEKDDRIVTLREQLQNISAMGGFSDTVSI